AVDGLKDGLIDDPRRCDFDAARDVPACPPGESTSECLTAGEARAINQIYAGPQSQGKPLFPGFMPGSEAPTTSPWGNAPPGSAWLGLIVPATPGGRVGDFALAQDT